MRVFGADVVQSVEACADVGRDDGIAKDGCRGDFLDDRGG